MVAMINIDHVTVTGVKARFFYHTTGSCMNGRTLTGTEVQPLVMTRLARNWIKPVSVRGTESAVRYQRPTEH
jgi:hypothetical protein